MGDQTGVEWTGPNGKTWNPWHGCLKVSRGCKFCYMYREKKRYGQDPSVVMRSKTRFYDPLKWHEPANVFTCSWSDFFIAEADAWRGEAWSIIKQTKHLTYQILTKRTERVLDHLPADWGDGYDNVHLGFSAETQDDFDRRWEEIKNVPARVLFLSAEPLLGPINLSEAVSYPVFCGSKVPISAATLTALKEVLKSAAKQSGFRGLDWVIVGGESGRADEDVRPTHPEWVRSLRDQCISANVPFFFKQWGEYKPLASVFNHDDEMFPSALADERKSIAIDGRGTIYWNEGDEPPVPGTAKDAYVLTRVGKKAAGRLLDGREWNEMPAV